MKNISMATILVGVLVAAGLVTLYITQARQGKNRIPVSNGTGSYNSTTSANVAIPIPGGRIGRPAVCCLCVSIGNLASSLPSDDSAGILIISSFPPAEIRP